jgi:hypothetical protein
MCKVVFNKELNGVELAFETKPEAKILEALKAGGFRWHNVKKVWYAKQNEKTLALAKEMSGEAGEAEEAQEEVESAMPISLWEKTRWDESTNNVDKKLTTKEIAAIVRKQVRARFPEVKFSLTCSGHSSISFDILSAPYEKESVYLNAIQDYCTKLIDSYNYCTCYDPYGDYGSSYNFYGDRCVISYHYEQTDVSETIKKDMADFDSRKAEYEAEQKRLEEIQFQEHMKQMEQDKIKAEEYHKQNEIDTQYIKENVTCKDIPEEQQYMILGAKFAKLNKNNTLEEYYSEVESGEYNNNDVKIQRELYFEDEKAYNLFANKFLHDFDFLKETGGTYTNDFRVNSMVDYSNMSKEERESVVWNLYGIAVFLKNDLKFVINTEGYSYARYVGLTEEATKGSETIEEETQEQIILKFKGAAVLDFHNAALANYCLSDNWKGNEIYRTKLLEMLESESIKLSKEVIQQVKDEEVKVELYKILYWYNSLWQQIERANIKAGDKLTLYYISDFGGIIESRITFDEAIQTKYAQYDKAVKLVFTPERKRNKYYGYFHEAKTLIVYRGWLTLPKTVLHEVKQEGNMIITKTKFLSCDRRQYIEIKKHYEQKGGFPIVDTTI